MHTLDMEMPFNEIKTTQAAAFFIKKSGGKEDLMKIIKLLYLADREALIKWGRPMTYDHYVSMNKGPVLSKTLDLINLKPLPGGNSFWNQHISPSQDYMLSVTSEPGDGELSDAEIALMQDIYERYKNMDVWTMIRDVMHKLPEWVDPHGSAIPIEYHDILVADGRKTASQVAAIEDELKHVASSNYFFGK